MQTNNAEEQQNNMMVSTIRSNKKFKSRDLEVPNYQIKEFRTGTPCLKEVQDL